MPCMITPSWTEEVHAIVLAEVFGISTSTIDTDRGANQLTQCRNSDMLRHMVNILSSSHGAGNG